jgi:hypothetical protein
MKVDQQIKSAERELAMRKNVYNRRVASGQMGMSAATHELTAMAEIIETLQKVKNHLQTGDPIKGVEL